MKNWIQKKMRDPMVALASGQFGLGMMQTLFMFYYVKVYLNVYKIDEFWFSIAQGMFLVWNAVNDPLFGYMQDSPGWWLNDRRAVVWRLSPFLALSFVLIWINAPYEQGLHLVISLFLYDAFYSAIGVAWSAMFAEIGSGPVARASAMKHSQLAILFSVNIIPIADKVSNSLQATLKWPALEDFASFQTLSIVAAVIGCICLLHCASISSLPVTMNERERLLAGGQQKKLDMKIIKQVISRRDFLCILFVNCIHTARSVIHMNFAAISTELLVPESILPKGSISLAVFYAVCTLSPQIIVILCEDLVVRKGAHFLAQFSFIATIIGAGSMYLFGSSPYVVMVYMFFDSVTVHSTASLFNILISEFVEDDFTRHHRMRPLSSLAFGLNALFVKPSQSIAPLLIVYFLNAHGYESWKTSSISSTELVESVRFLLFVPSIFLASAQFLVFRGYSISNQSHYPRSNRLL